MTSPLRIVAEKDGSPLYALLSDARQELRERFVRVTAGFWAPDVNYIDTIGTLISSFPCSR